LTKVKTVWFVEQKNKIVFFCNIWRSDQCRNRTTHLFIEKAFKQTYWRWKIL